MDVQTDYREEIRLFKSTGAKVWFGLLLLALLAIPTVLESHPLNLLALAAIHAIVAIGLNLLIGYTGQISLRHVAFTAIGASPSGVIRDGFKRAPFGLSPSTRLMANVIVQASKARQCRSNLLWLMTALCSPYVAFTKASLSRRK